MARLETGVEIEKRDLGSGIQGKSQEIEGRMNTKGSGAFWQIWDLLIFKKGKFMIAGRK